MKTLVGSEPPSEEPVEFDLHVEVVPDVPEALPAQTPIEIIDQWLDTTRHRNMFTSIDVMNMLLDIRNSLGAQS